MRVLIVTLHFAPEPTGNAPYVTKLAEGLVARGHECSVITAFPHYPQWDFYPDHVSAPQSGWWGSVRLRRVRHRLPAGGVGLSRALSELSFGFSSILTKWPRVDVVIAVSPGLLAAGLAVVRGRAAGVPVGVIVQDVYSAGVLEMRGIRGASAVAAVERATLRAANGVAVIHDRFRRRLETSLRVDPARIEVIRNWTHLSETISVDRGRMRQSLGWSARDLIVLHTGAMGEKQGLSTVVEAARVSAKRSMGIHFVLLGDGGQRSSLEKQAGSLPTMSFVDPVDDAVYPGVLASADVLLVHERPGVTEMAVPSKLTSYFRAGRPILAATEENSTTAEEIRAADAGVVVRPGDPEALLRGVQEISTDPRREEWSVNGQAYCREMLDESAALDKYEAWLRGLAGQGPRRRAARDV